MGLIDLVFPKACLECGGAGRYICENCLRKVPVGGWINRYSFSIFRYKGVIRKAIIALKYKYSTEIAKELADICVGRLIASHYRPKVTLIPIPLHWYRHNFRGFNQSEEVGKLIAEKMRWKFIPDLIIKKRSTPPQVGLKDLVRRRNLRDVFAVNSRYLLPAGNYPPVLFDDVFTTGSTLKEVEEVLTASGITGVLSLTIAR